MDSSSSICSEIVEHEQAEQAEIITYLERKLREAALVGNSEVFRVHGEQLNCLVTPNQNTVLHFYLAIPNYGVGAYGCFPIFFWYKRYKYFHGERSTNFVDEILEICPSLLWKPNAKGEIPLHIAARFGHTNIVERLIKTAKAEPRDLENEIESVKKMLRMTDNEGNTALHQAVRYGHFGVVQALIQEDPFFSVNSSGEPPLYIAARRGYYRLVGLILDKSNSADHDGPSGRTALHAAVMSQDIRSARIILQKKKLTKIADKNGQTPLHYAAHLGYNRIVKLLLDFDESVAYIIDKERMTALHMAARQGHRLTMQEIIKRCPDCCEIVDKRGWNFYHFAVVSTRMTALFLIFGAIHYRRFLDEKDIHGNTPLQLLAATRQRQLNVTRGFRDDIALDLRMENPDSKKKEQIFKLMEEVSVGEVADVAIHPLHHRKTDQGAFDKAKKSRSVVGALIATVAFSAALTLPGGYKTDHEDQHRGTAILSHNSAFKAFVIADTIALFCSLIAINLNTSSVRPFITVKGRQFGWYSYNLVLMFNNFAEAALIVAFVTGIYAVLKPSFAIAIITIMSCSFVGYIWLASLSFLIDY